MMFGTREEFAYWECATCGLLEIASLPERMEQYYPDDYYSFSSDSKVEKRWKHRASFLASPFLWKLGLLGRLHPFRAVSLARPKTGARVLDVGSGAGDLTSILRSIGFDAHGIDPFLKNETEFTRRMELKDVDPGWDLIMFHHSLEHMTDHLSVLREVRAKLNRGGQCLVRIPVAAWAWAHYGKDWVQLDPPRHLLIHTVESFRRLAESAGFRFAKVLFDSTDFQFTGSELYRRDVPLLELEKALKFSEEEMRDFQKRADELNREGRGDQACFYLEAVQRN
jgi:SAM-dependent methyltransferase